MNRASRTLAAALGSTLLMGANAHAESRDTRTTRCEALQSLLGDPVRAGMHVAAIARNETTRALSERLMREPRAEDMALVTRLMAASLDDACRVTR